MLTVIILAGVDINLRQLNDGYTWVYKKHIGENSKREAEARQYRRALWAGPSPDSAVGVSSGAPDETRKEIAARAAGTPFEKQQQMDEPIRLILPCTIQGMKIRTKRSSASLHAPNRSRPSPLSAPYPTITSIRLYSTNY
jgi:hypothetical protein